MPSSCFSSSSLERRTTVIPGKYPVPHTSFELDGDTLQGGVSTRDGQERERDSCHKSGPEPTSEWLWREAQSGDGDASHKADEVWSGDASLQQTSVLGPGDGCGAKPEGNANEIQGVVADCYKGRPGSSGSSLGSKSHLQSSEGTSSTSVLPQTRTHSQHNKKRLSRQVARCPPEDTAFEGDFDCGEMDESGGVEDISRVCLTDSAAAAVQTSRLGSLVSRVSWIVHDVGRLLWSSSTVLQQVREEGLQPVGTRWSSHVVSMVRKSSVLSIVNESKVFSMVKGSIVFSLLKDSHIFSMVKELPLIQRIQMTQNPQQKKATLGCIDPDTTQLPVVTPTQSFRKAGESPVDMLPRPEDIRPKNESDWGLQLTKRHAMAGRWVNQEEKLAKELKGGGELEVFHATEDKDQTSKHLSPLQNKMDVQISSQTLIKFPDSILSLQTLPLLDLMDTLHTIIPTSVLISQKIVAVYWLNVAKYSQPEPRPGLLILLETGLYTLTTDTGLLLLFHHLSWMQLKEVQISFGGHSLRLISTTEDSILGVYTHSQKLTKELCRAMLGIIHTGDSWVSQHPLLHGDLMKMSLDWETYVPDLLLDAGLRVCCQFQKSLADLVYLLHCNMDQEMVSLGQVRLLLYTGVGVCLSHSTCTEHLAQLLLTDTHLGLVQEDAVFNGAPCSVTTDWRCPQFHDLILRQRSDVRCVLVHDEDERGVVRLDVILANGGGRGHPESTTKATTLPPHVSDSSPRAEVWKLTFSCSSEAACLINHLSNG